jgi:hypothetical protein
MTPAVDRDEAVASLDKSPGGCEVVDGDQDVVDGE